MLWRELDNRIWPHICSWRLPIDADVSPVSASAIGRPDSYHTRVKQAILEGVGVASLKGGPESV
jgi:hypothetical protein